MRTGILMMKHNLQILKGTEFVAFISNQKISKEIWKENCLVCPQKEKFYYQVKIITKITYITWILYIFDIFCISLSYFVYLSLGAIPSTEKQERTRSNTKSKQKSRPNNTSNALSSNTLYQEISTESPMDSYHTPLLIVRDNTKVIAFSQM